jgi:hypothetical protein
MGQGESREIDYKTPSGYNHLDIPSTHTSMINLLLDQILPKNTILGGCYVVIFT